MEKSLKNFLDKNSDYLDLLAQQQRVNDRLPALHAELQALARQVKEASAESKRQSAMELRGIAPVDAVNAALSQELLLREQYDQIAYQIETVSGVGGDMAVEVMAASQAAQRALVDYMDVVTDTIAKSAVDRGLKARVLEVAVGKMCANNLTDGIFIERFWDLALAHLFPTPDQNEVEKAVASFRKKYEVPVLGR